MKEKVLLAMSGGVDSSVAALILKKQGYEVIGAFMKNWSDTKDLQGQCAWRGERKYAIKIAAQLDIPLITLDFEKEYKEDVVAKMFDKYKKGITPNPDIDCNQKIKFPLLIREAKKRGINIVATGHYVRKINNELYRGKDESNIVEKLQNKAEEILLKLKYSSDRKDHRATLWFFFNSCRLFGVRVDGKIEIRFDKIMKHPPFDDKNKRQELANRLNEISGINLPATLTLTGYPSISTIALKNNDSLDSFFKAFDW